MVTASLAAGIIFCQVRSIGVDVENHVARVEGDDGLLLGGGVVEELFDALHVFFSVGAFCCAAMELRAGSIELSMALA